MGININRAIVKALPDESGVEYMTEFMKILASSKKNSHQGRVKFEYLIKALSRLSLIQKKDLPNSMKPFYTTLEIDIDGITYSKSFELIKDLRKMPIYELRINIKEYNWRFRATFFPKYHEGQLYYCFVYPFTKHPDEDDPTDKLRDATYQIFLDTRVNPDKYFNK